MGACTGKSKGPKTQSVHVGGGDHGVVQWVRLKGVQISNPSSKTGWEMKFNVDSNQTVTGGTKADSKNGNKEYSGTFKNGILDALCTFEDGAQIKYEGKLENGTMNVKCTVQQPGSHGNYTEGDIAIASGPLKYD